MTEPARGWPAGRAAQGRVLFGAGAWVPPVAVDAWTTLQRQLRPRQPVRSVAGGTACCPRGGAGTEVDTLEARGRSDCSSPWSETPGVSGGTGPTALHGDRVPATSRGAGPGPLQFQPRRVTSWPPSSSRAPCSGSWVVALHWAAAPGEDVSRGSALLGSAHSQWGPDLHW